MAATGLQAQESSAPDNSLGDVARQTRAQHNSSDSKPSKAQDLVDEMQQEQEESDNAPTGFKSYDAGDYRLLVPFPYSLEGRENGGPVLLGSSLGITNTEVLAGTPIPISTDRTDAELIYIARQLASSHAQYPACSVSKQGEHKVIRCSWNGSPRLLGREVWGTMEFVVAANRLVPVMCVSADEMQCLSYSNSGGWGVCNKPNATWAEVEKTRKDLETRFRDEKTTFQVCDQIIYPSIHLKEDTVVHPAKIGEAPTVKTVSAAVPQDTSVSASGQASESLGDLARKSRQAPRPAAQAKLDNSEEARIAPPGFQSFSLQFCLNPQVCGEASVLIPEKAEMLSHVNGQHIFKMLQDGNPVLLYAGPADVNAPYRSMTDPDYIRMRDLANSNGWSREKTDGVSTQEMTIEGRPALMTRFRYLRDQKSWWIGERTLIGPTGAQFLAACTAPEEHFADAEVLCTTLVNSLRFP
ncbi:MAG TPA: hypothetical protein VKV39_06310 [Candidatus Sulfotelmatobacter sp.]|nr:hypothetical protein [Candidatus Sulfotelmatobacter sp.]